MVDIEKLQDNIYVANNFNKEDVEFSEQGVKVATVIVILMGSRRGVYTTKKPSIDMIIDKLFIYIFYKR